MCRQYSGNIRPCNCEVTHSRTAQGVCLLQNRVEHWRQIAGRGIDHLQHLGSRGLLLQCLPLLSDQPRILDGDDRLIGEGADEFYLSVSEWLTR